MRFPVPTRTMYLIDGVQVSPWIYDRRMEWGEHGEANFDIEDVRILTKDGR
jgi:hypothetical protein